MAKTVCIIGCGVSGLVSVKHCIAAGLIPTCYESSSHIGGLWNSKNENAVPDCTVTNTSKELSAFSDFPMPASFPNFMHSEKLMEYFDAYVAKNDLMKSIQLGCEVVNLETCATHSNCLCAECVKSAGKYWKVTVLKCNKEFEAYYDFLIVATGFNSQPFITEEVKGILKGFTGNVLHSSKYKTWKEFENQNVLVYGLGNSGGDIASELSRHASQVFLSTKHGSYVLNRLKFSGYPLDAKVLRHSSSLVPNCVKQLMIKYLCNSTFNHENFGLEPLGDSSKSNSNPVINDELWTRISTGTLLIKPSVLRTDGKTVLFSDGTAVNVDAIILCTGYKRYFSFLKDQDLLGIPAKAKFFSLYNYIFPITHPGKAAVIGISAVSGSVFPVFEMQARYAVEVFKGAVYLPSIKEMKESLEKRSLQYQQVYKSQKEPLHVNFVSYQDDIAAIIGAKPSIWKLMLIDPVLAFHLFFGPSCPYQYRLTGPGSWSGARDAILNLDKRIWYPFQKIQQQKSSKFTLQMFIFLLLSILLVIFTFVCFFRFIFQEQ